MEENLKILDNQIEILLKKQEEYTNREEGTVMVLNLSLAIAKLVELKHEIKKEAVLYKE